jgi:hypothetical protein
MKKIIVITSLLLVIRSFGYGQAAGTQLIYGNINLSTINNSFVSDFSAANGAIGYSFFVRNNLAIGGEIGWNNYNQYAPKRTYHFAGEDATTDLYKYIYTLPITATITRYFNAGKVFSPYAKIGLGIQYSDQNLYYNVYETTNNNLGFVAIPEVGVKVQFARYSPWCMTAGVRYSYGTNSTSQYNINNIQTFSYSVGFAWQITHFRNQF